MLRITGDNFVPRLNSFSGNLSGICSIIYKRILASALAARPAPRGRPGGPRAGARAPRRRPRPLGPSAPSVVTPAGRAGRGASLRPGGRQGFRVRLRSRSRARVSAIGGEGRVCKCVHSCPAKEVRYSGVCTEAEGTRQGLPGRPSREVKLFRIRRAGRPRDPLRRFLGLFPSSAAGPWTSQGRTFSSGRPGHCREGDLSEVRPA